jgi:hypothetical protein
MCEQRVEEERVLKKLVKEQRVGYERKGDRRVG